MHNKTYDANADVGIDNMMDALKQEVYNDINANMNQNPAQ